MTAKLYVIPASHPARTAAMMLDRKGIAYKRVDLLPMISRPTLRALRFSGVTVPALKLDGERVQGSRAIARFLDRVQPEPPLFPTDPDARSKVEEAEAWAEHDLQNAARRILWNGMRRDRSPLRSYSEGARLGVPVGLATRTAAPIVALEVRVNEATDENTRADVAALPDMLDRIDGWIAEGVIGGEPNAADLQIATSLALMMTLADLRPAIEARPAGQLALRIDPDYPGQMPPVLPRDWLEPLAAA